MVPGARKILICVCIGHASRVPSFYAVNHQLRLTAKDPTRAMPKGKTTTYRDMYTRVQMPIGVRQPRELRWDTALEFELLLPAILVPLEQEVYETVAFEGVVGACRNCIEEVLECLWAGRRIDGIWLADLATREKDVEEKLVGHVGASHFDFSRSRVAPWEIG